MNNEHNVSCVDCGPAPAIHWIERFTSVVSWLTEPLQAIGDKIFPLKVTPLPSPLWGKLSLAIFKILHALRLARLVTAPESGDTGRVQTMWEAAIKRGVTVYRLRLFNLPSELFVARYKNYTWLFTSLPRPFGCKNFGKEWMDSKEHMRERFAKADIPIARGGTISSWSSAQKIFKDINGSVITKPTYGSRSRHTVMHIRTEQELRHGYDVAKRMGPWVVLEEELQGSVYRVAVIAGNVVAALRRDPPLVFGDGKSTVKELIAIANSDPRRHGPVFHEITVDNDALLELEYQKLTFDSIPEQGWRISLAQKVGRGNGGTNTDVTDSVHPENIKLFKKVLEVLEDSLVGIDCIMHDISKPWYEQKPSGIIECNSVPFLDLHHFPFEGKVQDAAGALWNAVLKSLDSAEINRN